MTGTMDSASVMSKTVQLLSSLPVRQHPYIDALLSQSVVCSSSSSSISRLVVVVKVEGVKRYLCGNTSTKQQRHSDFFWHQNLSVLNHGCWSCL